MIALLFAVVWSGAQTDLTFVRHAETVANATGKYNSATLNTFSAKGEAQVAALTQRLLAQPKFDRILVSPSPRAMRTILPYLRAMQARATIWPLLYECCTQRRPKGAHATKFSNGGRISLDAADRDCFQIVPGHDRLPNAPDYNSGLAQVSATLAEFRSLYAGGRILIIGHSGHGGQFLRALTGKVRKVENATEMRVVVSSGW